MNDIKDTKTLVSYWTRKAQKLTAALYKVTEAVDHEEPLRWYVRKEGLNLLGTMLLLESKASLKGDLVNKAIHSVSQITSLLEVSFVGSMVSQMNFSILRDEYEMLQDGLYALAKGQNWHQLVLSVDINEIEASRKVQGKGQEALLLKDNSKGQKPGTVTPRASKVMSHEKEQISHGKRKNEKGREKRQEIVLGIIQNEKEVSIKDILSSSLIAGLYSEKTIQRELVDLLNKGLIKKKGERRWSRYYV